VLREEWGRRGGGGGREEETIYDNPKATRDMEVYYIGNFREIFKIGN